MTDYNILNRAIFYISRMISSQKNREFKGSNYNDIKKVYSIWICMNMKEDSMNHIHLINDTIIGNQNWRGREDLINIVMIGLTKEVSPREEKHELHRLLGALLSETLREEEKLNILKNEYHIPMEKSIEEDVKVMCNLSEGIEERGIMKGRAEGRAEGKAEGREEGRKEGERIGEERLANLLMKLSKQNRQEDSIKALEDLEYRKKLYEEFGV